MIIAVDFDGTIVTHKFPEMGEPIYKVIRYLKKAKKEGHKIILWTCREDEYLKEAVEHCQFLGIELDAVNKNLEGTPSNFARSKILADIYLDDRALNIKDVNNETP